MGVDLYFEDKKRTISVDESFPPLKFQGGGLNECKYLWFALIEKAFAKYHGSYEDLVGGSRVEALTSITGQPCWNVELEKLSLKDISSYLKKGFCLSVGANKHAWSISAVGRNEIYLFEPNNLEDYSRSDGYISPGGDSRKVSGKSGLFRMSWDSFRRVYRTNGPGALAVAWFGKYKRVNQHTQKNFGRNGSAYCLEVNRTTSASDIVLGGFQPSQRGKTHSNYPTLAYNILVGRTDMTFQAPTSVCYFAFDGKLILQPSQKYILRPASNNANITTSLWVRKDSGVSLTVQVQSARS